MFGQGTVPVLAAPVLVPPAAGVTAPIPRPEAIRKTFAETHSAIPLIISLVRRVVDALRVPPYYMPRQHQTRLLPSPETHLGC